MSRLKTLEGESLHILSEAHRRYAPLALLWSTRRASTVLLWLARQAFAGQVPFPVIYLETGLDGPAARLFRDRLARDWRLDLHVVPCPPPEGFANTGVRKAAALRAVIESDGLRGLVFGMHADEAHLVWHDKAISPCAVGGACSAHDVPPEFLDLYRQRFPACAHHRIHPLAHWSEADVGRYALREEVPEVAPAETAAAVRGDPDREHARLDSFLAELGWLGDGDRNSRDPAPSAADAVTGDGPWRGACHT